MKILLINNKTKFLKNLKSWLAGNEITVVNYDKIIPKMSDKFDLIILTGGHSYSVANHSEKYKKEINLIKKTKTPIVGICLGFEIIAYTYGCKLTRLKNKEKGATIIKVIKPNIIVQGLHSFKAYESHRWALEQINKNLEAVTRSKNGINIIKHVSRPIYGFQFHPEVIVNKNLSKTLLANILAILRK